MKLTVREIKENELNELLELYTHLHETGIPEQSEKPAETWATIINDKNHHIIVAEENSKLVSSVVCVIIPNLTRNIRPYAFVENVVTHSDYRKQGYATACLNYAREIAKKENCYKMMLLTSAKTEDTLGIRDSNPVSLKLHISRPFFRFLSYHTTVCLRQKTKK